MPAVPLSLPLVYLGEFKILLPLLRKARVLFIAMIHKLFCMYMVPKFRT
jgi:hypothetical protein